MLSLALSSLSLVVVVVVVVAVPAGGGARYFRTMRIKILCRCWKSFWLRSLITWNRNSWLFRKPELVSFCLKQLDCLSKANLMSLMYKVSSFGIMRFTARVFAATRLRHGRFSESQFARLQFLDKFGYNVKLPGLEVAQEMYACKKLSYSQHTISIGSHDLNSQDFNSSVKLTVMSSSWAWRLPKNRLNIELTKNLL